MYAHNKFMDVVLLFTTEIEKELFIDYASTRKDRIDALIKENSCSYSWIESGNKRRNGQMAESVKVGKALKRMLVEYREAGEKG